MTTSQDWPGQHPPLTFQNVVSKASLQESFQEDTLWETGGFQKAWKQAVPLGHTDSTLKLQNTLNSALAKIQPVI